VTQIAVGAHRLGLGLELVLGLVVESMEDLAMSLIVSNPKANCNPNLNSNPNSHLEGLGLLAEKRV
jgi:hypothetical protein